MMETASRFSFLFHKKLKREAPVVNLFFITCEGQQEDSNVKATNVTVRKRRKFQVISRVSLVTFILLTMTLSNSKAIRYRIQTPCSVHRRQMRSHEKTF